MLHKKLFILLALLLLTIQVEVTNAGWWSKGGKAALDFVGRVAADVAVDAASSFFKKDVKQEKVAALRKKVEDLDRQLSAYKKANDYSHYEIKSFEKTVIGLSKLLNAMDGRMSSGERIALIEAEIISLQKIIQGNQGSSPTSAWKIREPIDNIFRAWERLDIDLYMRQWSKDGVQLSSNFYRSYSDIKRKRRYDFKHKYRKVTARYSIENLLTTKKLVIVGVSYSMSFQLNNGRQFNENAKERYVLSYDSRMGKWLIKENYDYIGE